MDFMLGLGSLKQWWVTRKEKAEAAHQQRVESFLPLARRINAGDLKTRLVWIDEGRFVPIDTKPEATIEVGVGLLEVDVSFWTPTESAIAGAVVKLANRERTLQVKHIDPKVFWGFRDISTKPIKLELFSLAQTIVLWPPPDEA